MDRQTDKQTKIDRESDIYTVRSQADRRGRELAYGAKAL